MKPLPPRSPRLGYLLGWLTLGACGGSVAEEPVERPSPEPVPLEVRSSVDKAVATTGDVMIPIANWEVDDAAILRIEYSAVANVTVAVFQVGE